MALLRSEWGGVWARALVDSSYKDKFVKDPLQAVIDLCQGLTSSCRPLPVQPGTTPLFDTNDPNNYIKYFLNTIKIDFTTRETTQILHNNLHLIDPLKLNNLRNQLKGNEFTLIRKNPLQPFPLPPQNIDIADDPNGPLTRDDWMRIYTKISRSPTVFRPGLEQNPAQAIDDFNSVHGHPPVHNRPHPVTNVRVPIFTFPDINDLENIISAIDPTDPLITIPNKLRDTLMDIANGISQDYEAEVQVNLSC